MNENIARLGLSFLLIILFNGCIVFQKQKKDFNIYISTKPNDIKTFTKVFKKIAEKDIEMFNYPKEAIDTCFFRINYTYISNKNREYIGGFFYSNINDKHPDFFISNLSGEYLLLLNFYDFRAHKKINLKKVKINNFRLKKVNKLVYSFSFYKDFEKVVSGRTAGETFLSNSSLFLIKHISKNNKGYTCHNGKEFHYKFGEKLRQAFLSNNINNVFDVLISIETEKCRRKEQDFSYREHYFQRPTPCDWDTLNDEIILELE